MKTVRHHSQPEYLIQSYYGPYRPESSQRLRDWLTAFAVGFSAAALLFVSLST